MSGICILSNTIINNYKKKYPFKKQRVIPNLLFNLCDKHSITHILIFIKWFLKNEELNF